MSYTTVAHSLLPARHWARTPATSMPGPGPADDERAFTIRMARDEERDAAGELLQRRYAWRGYRTVQLPSDQTGWRTTLSAHEATADGDMAIGTLTLEIDGGPEGLSAAAAFGPEIAALRAEGRRLVEFTRLAVETHSHSQRVLAGLFHVGYIVAHKLRGCDTLLLEVNPRHVRFYERMLGCRVIGPVREHPGVKAPAVLLSAPFAYIRAQIRAHAGTGEHAGDARSLYPFAFTADDEAGIVARLVQAQFEADTTAH
jgi:hypothetical protein